MDHITPTTCNENFPYVHHELQSPLSPSAKKGYDEGLKPWVVPSGMVGNAGQGHIPESLPRPRWVGQHMQAYRTTISVHTCKHTCKHTVPPTTALSLHTYTTAVH